MQLTKATTGRSGAVLLTGGGARNHFLVERIAVQTGLRVDVPECELVDQKEALVFALLGILRLQERANCLASVTGARHDSVGGALYLPNSQGGHG